MPIDLKRFEEEGTEVEAGPKHDRKSQVKELLQENAGQAFTQKEVSEQIGISSTHARSVLYGMFEDGIVDRKLVENEEGKELIHYTWVGGDEEQE